MLREPDNKLNDKKNARCKEQQGKWRGDIRSLVLRNA
jgi:hypothetical protein